MVASHLASPSTENGTYPFTFIAATDPKKANGASNRRVNLIFSPQPTKETGIALAGTTGAFWVKTLKQSDKRGNESASFPAIQMSITLGTVIQYQSWMLTEIVRDQTTWLIDG